MTEYIEVEDPTDVREGDLIEATFDGHPFGGVVWRTKGGGLAVGSSIVEYDDGRLSLKINITRIQRPKPELPSLPSEPGSVIVDVELWHGKENHPLAVLSERGDWYLPSADYMHAAPREITSWSPATVVKS